MYLVAIGWIYVVLMMAAAELASPSGTVLGAVITLLLYGLLPVSVLMYIMAAPLRSKARRKREREESATDAGPADPPSALDQPDSGSHSPSDSVTPVRKES